MSRFHGIAKYWMQSLACSRMTLCWKPLWVSKPWVHAFGNFRLQSLTRLWMTLCWKCLCATRPWFHGTVNSGLPLRMLPGIMRRIHGESCGHHSRGGTSMRWQITWSTLGLTRDARWNHIRPGRRSFPPCSLSEGNLTWWVHDNVGA